MGTRTVRLDEESERLLADIRRATGLSVSDALKRGLVALRDVLAARTAAEPFAVYERLDLGAGGYARAPARQAKRAVREVVRRKHRT